MFSKVNTISPTGTYVVFSATLCDIFYGNINDSSLGFFKLNFWSAVKDFKVGWIVTVLEFFPFIKIR